MIEIEEPPPQLACSECSSVVGWLYSGRHRVWLAVTNPDPTDRDLLRIHRCEIFGRPTSYKHLTEQPPEVKQRGAALAQAVIDVKVNKKSITEYRDLLDPLGLTEGEPDDPELA